MKYLNLTEGFNPCSAEEKDIIEFESFTFSGGEPHIKIKYNFDNVIDETNTFTGWMNIKITHRIQSFNDLGLLCVAVDALRELYPINEMYLHLPYFPGARQDRRMVDGEPLTVKVYADIINSLKFDMVTILDSHSDVAPALIDNCKSLSNHEFVENVTNDLGGDVVLISPDAGSNKKMHSLCKYLDMDSFIRCDKDRDVSTGAIKGFNVFHDDFNKDTEYLIVDDICDGGGTFTGLAKELKTKGATRLSLAVTHGIFSKGFSQLNNYFDVIYTTKSFDGQRSSKTKEL